MSNPLAILAGRYPRAGISQPVDFSRFTAAWSECCYASASCRAQADPADCVVAFDSPRKGGIEPNRSHGLSRGHEPTRVASIQLPFVERKARAHFRANTEKARTSIDDLQFSKPKRMRPVRLAPSMLEAAHMKRSCWPRLRTSALASGPVRPSNPDKTTAKFAQKTCRPGLCVHLRTGLVNLPSPRLDPSCEIGSRCIECGWRPSQNPRACPVQTSRVQSCLKFKRASKRSKFQALCVFPLCVQPNVPQLSHARDA